MTVIIVFVFFWQLKTQWCHSITLMCRTATIDYCNNLIICLIVYSFIQPTGQNLKTLHSLSLMAKKKQQIDTFNELERKRFWHCFGAGKVEYSELIRGQKQLPAAPRNKVAEGEWRLVGFVKMRETAEWVMILFGFITMSHTFCHTHMIYIKLNV